MNKEVGKGKAYEWKCKTCFYFKDEQERSKVVFLVPVDVCPMFPQYSGLNCEEYKEKTEGDIERRGF